jgi:hypothetical protein
VASVALGPAGYSASNSVLGAMAVVRSAGLHAAIPDPRPHRVAGHLQPGLLAGRREHQDAGQQRSRVVRGRRLPLQQRRIKDLLEEKARTIQESHGGIDGVIDKLLDQAATFGAMCGEWILNED